MIKGQVNGKRHLAPAEPLATELDVEELAPADRTSFSLREVATRLWCSTRHMFDLVIEGEIVVQKAQIEGARSRSEIRVTRAAFVDFVLRRSGKAWLDQKRREKEAANASISSPKKRRGKT